MKYVTEFNPREAQSVLDKISYKDFTFFLQPEKFGLWSIGLKAIVKDNFGDGMVDIGNKIHLYCSEKDYIVHTCWSLVRQYEMHEAGERFYMDGKLPYDPHKKGLVNV